MTGTDGCAGVETCDNIPICADILSILRIETTQQLANTRYYSVGHRIAASNLLFTLKKHKTFVVISTFSVS